MNQSSSNAQQLSSGSAAEPAEAVYSPSPPVADAPTGGGQGIGGLSGRLQRMRPPPKLYRIGEVVEYSKVGRQTVHNYTTMGLLQANRWTPGGHRLYDESVFERLQVISELKLQRKSLQDIRDYFEQAEAGGSEAARLGPTGQRNSQEGTS